MKIIIVIEYIQRFFQYICLCDYKVFPFKNTVSPEVLCFVLFKNCAIYHKEATKLFAPISMGFPYILHRTKPNMTVE